MTKGPFERQILDSAGILLAIVVSSRFAEEGAHFVTPDDLQQQVAVMRRPQGHKILAHTHLSVARSIRGTHEVLIIQEGRIRADIFDNSRSFVTSEILVAGDIIVLVSGGHGFEILETSKFIEVKQGPYIEGRDKEIFEPESPH